MPESEDLVAGPDTIKRLGAELRALREASGVSGRALASRLGWSQAKLSRTETGVVRPIVADVEDFLEQVAAPPAARRRVRELAAQAQTVSTGWKALHRGGLAQRQRELDELLGLTTRVLHYQPIFIPGLLQTPEYARRVFELINWSKNRDIGQAVAARMAKQQALFEPNAPDYHFVLTEAALRWRPGPMSLLATQLDRVRSLAELPSVTLRVIPWSTEISALGPHPFVAYTLRDEQEPPEIHVETVSAEVVVTGEEASALYTETFNRLVADALDPGDSKTFIQELADTLHEVPQPAHEKGAQ